MKIVVLVSGGGTNLQTILDRIADGTLPNVQISKVIASRAGIKALERADNSGIPWEIISLKSFPDFTSYDRAMKESLVASEAELVVLAGFLSFIGAEVLAAFPNKVINIHPALLPAFGGKGMYGIRPHQAALQRGVKLTGATVHFVNENYDEGAIILQKATAVRPDDTAEILQKRVMQECEQVILPEAIRLFASRQIQIVGQVTKIL